ncbi:MAG: bifunctional folylpolyglutamate synthase/dihydrofolate synthase, partial [Lachnospiraceae bacterium]
MTEEEAFAYYQKLGQLGSVPGLEVIRELLRRLGNPQEGLPVVQIAGTNGKGSVGAFLRSILKQAGITTASFSSPAVYHYRESILLNHQMISSSEYAGYMEQVRFFAEQMASEGKPHPTAFEVETALAFVFAAAHGVSVFLVETGMGGTLDATNVCRRNLCSVVTTVAKDHTSFLGETLGEIAAHKAGIFKERCPVVLQRQCPEVMQVLLSRAEELECPVSLVDCRQVDVIRQNYEGTLGLKGEFQYENAALAACAARCLKKQGFPLTERHIRDGLMNAVWRGRFTKIGDLPEFWVDGAHNPNGAAALCATIQKQFAGRPIFGIMGVFRDKEAAQMGRLVSPYMQ